jgi:hypothetical protein
MRYYRSSTDWGGRGGSDGCVFPIRINPQLQSSSDGTSVFSVCTSQQYKMSTDTHWTYKLYTFTHAQIGSFILWLSTVYTEPSIHHHWSFQIRWYDSRMSQTRPLFMVKCNASTPACFIDTISDTGIYTEHTIRHWHGSMVFVGWFVPAQVVMLPFHCALPILESNIHLWMCHTSSHHF